MEKEKENVDVAAMEDIEFDVEEKKKEKKLSIGLSFEKNDSEITKFEESGKKYISTILFYLYFAFSKWKKIKLTENTKLSNF